MVVSSGGRPVRKIEDHQQFLIIEFPGIGKQLLVVFILRFESAVNEREVVLPQPDHPSHIIQYGTGRVSCSSTFRLVWFSCTASQGLATGESRISLVVPLHGRSAVITTDPCMRTQKRFGILSSLF